MSISCPQCQKANPDNACFCLGCGTTLSATNVQGRTVVASTGQAGISPPVQAPPPQMPQAQSSSTPSPPKGLTDFHGMPASTGPNNQREHTIPVNDISVSMSSPFGGGLCKLDASKQASITLVLEKAQLDPNDEIGLVSFNHNACRLLDLCPLYSHKPQIIKTLQALQIDGGTDINAGLKTARDMFNWSRNDIVRRIVLLTDGHGGHPLRTAEDLKARGVVIDVIGVGDNPRNVDEKLLKQVASTIDGENHYWFIKDQQTLVKRYTDLANKTSVY